MRPSSCCCIVAPEQRQSLQESGLLLLASGEPVEPDSEEARQVLRPRVPALTRSTPLLFPLLARRQAAQPRCPGPDRIRPKPQGLSNSKRNAHPFLNNLARLHPRAPPRDCTTYGLERQGELHWIRLVSHSQSLTSVSRAGFLVERRLLLLLLAA